MRIYIIALACFCLLAACSSRLTDDTPSQAYARLFAAVKAKNTEAIRAEMSTGTQDLAEGLAQRQKKTVDEVFANGFTATTFADSLPEIRDERIKDNMGAIEVWNAKDRIWEDLPFMVEDGKWKLAIGELFSNKFQSPGKSRTQIEREAANAANPVQIPINQNTNIIPQEKYDGPQVEPLPNSNRRR
jgi:hypothetical protein